MPHGVMNIGRLSIRWKYSYLLSRQFLPVGLEFGQQYQRRPYCAAHSQQKENNAWQLN
jgi:hypothetical protein